MDKEKKIINLDSRTEKIKFNKQQKEKLKILSEKNLNEFIHKHFIKISGETSQELRKNDKTIKKEAFRSNSSFREIFDLLNGRDWGITKIYIIKIIGSSTPSCWYSFNLSAMIEDIKGGYKYVEGINENNSTKLDKAAKQKRFFLLVPIRN